MLDSSTCGSLRVTKNLSIGQVNEAVEVKSTEQLTTGVKNIME
ncbi:unnamed protein product [Rhodiola kirilowii]